MLYHMRYIGTRGLALSIVSAIMWIGIFCDPINFVIKDAMSPGAGNGGDSGYTMYERCHIDAAGILHTEYTHRPDC